MAPDPSFGQRLKARRKEMGLTQKQLAHAASFSEHTIRSWETGRLPPARESAQRIATILNLEPGTKEFDTFVGGDGDSQPVPETLPKLPAASLPLPPPGFSVSPNGATDYTQHSSNASPTLSAEMSLLPAPQEVGSGISPNNDFRKLFLDRVREIWVDGVLEPSLHGAMLIYLGLEYRPDAPPPSRNMVQAQSAQTNRSVPSGMKILELFNHYSELLILGAPGSGKTTLLLDLARSLLKRAVQDSSLPIPVVFNLSSWAARRLPFTRWLEEELKIGYKVPRKIGRELVASDQLLLLLDGLDEVAEQQQVACVQAINTFRDDHPVSIVVCSRDDGYERLKRKLVIQGTVFVQPLSDEQIGAFLDHAGSGLDVLRTSLQHDAGLRELAASPLSLSIMAQVYRDHASDPSIELETVEERRKDLLERYIDYVLGGWTNNDRAALDQARRWLSWLAQQLQRRSQTPFYLEQLQADWLPSAASRWHYALLDRLGGALLAGLGYGLIYGLLIWIYGVLVGMGSEYWTGLPHDMAVAALIGGLIGGLFGGHNEENQSAWHYALGCISGGVFFGLVGALITQSAAGSLALSIVGASAGVLTKRPSLQPRVINFETLYWSWQTARRRMPACLGGGIFLGLVMSLLLKRMDGLLGLLFDPLLGGLSTGLLIGFLVCMIFGITTSESEKPIVKRTRPNEGVRNAIRNALWAGAAGAVIGMLFGLLVTNGPISWAIMGARDAIIGALAFGGYTFLSHFALRYVLWWQGTIPWRYVRFLDICVDRALLHRVGGAYQFSHGLLLEQIAGATSERENDPPAGKAMRRLQSYIAGRVAQIWLEAAGLVTILLIIASGVYFGRAIAPARPAPPKPSFDVIIESGSHYDGTATYGVGLQAGDHVFVEAYGQMNLGSFERGVEPDGRARGFLGYPLNEAFKVVKTFPVGALLCKISSEHIWRKCGSQLDFIAQSSGHLEFLINDVDVSFHEGFFGINVTINAAH
jgi:transcriptional regulator with XRE-family HTH domain/DNA polymerase III delta prime subunit